MTQITHNIKPERVEDEITATLVNAQATRRETGNVRLDLGSYLYEAYMDRQARQAHLARSESIID